MQFERQLKKWGDTSVAVVIPADLLKYMNLKAEDTIVIQDDKGKHGPFCSFWKKDDQ